MRHRIIGTASSTIPLPTRRPTTSTSTAKRRNRESTARKPARRLRLCGRWPGGQRQAGSGDDRCGGTTSSEKAYHSSQFKVHPANPGSLVLRLTPGAQRFPEQEGRMAKNKDFETSTGKGGETHQHVPKKGPHSKPDAHLTTICGTAPLASAFSDDSSHRNGAVICPACQRGLGPLASMKSAM